ncbi:MAG: TPM domain-containing protein [Novosphingobium sp.]
MRIVTAWLLALLAFAATPALAAIPPRPAGPVLDQAGIIPDAQEAALDAKLRAYTQATGRSVIVATVSSLDDLPIDSYAQQLVEAWDIGGQTTEEGVLLLIAPTERQLRIAAARGVQERLTDALSGRIIRDTIAPRFKAGDFGGGIAAGVDAITTQLDRSPADAKAVAEAAAAASRQAGSGDKASFGGVAFWIVLILVFMFLFGRGGGRGGGRRGGRRFSSGGLGPIIVFDALSHLAGRGGGFGGGGFGGGGGDSGGGFGGFGGGGGGFDGGGASGDW